MNNTIDYYTIMKLLIVNDSTIQCRLNKMHHENYMRDMKDSVYNTYNNGNIKYMDMIADIGETEQFHEIILTNMQIKQSDDCYTIIYNIISELKSSIIVSIEREYFDKMFESYDMY